MTALLANHQDLEALADKSAHLMQQVRETKRPRARAVFFAGADGVQLRVAVALPSRSDARAALPKVPPEL